MRRALLILGSAIGLMFAAGCGGDDDTTQSPGVSGSATATLTASPASSATPSTPDGATPLPAGSGGGGEAPGSPVDAGTYYTGPFAPRVVFTIGDGWSNAGEKARNVLLLRKPEPGDIAFTFDSANSTSEDLELTVSRFTSIAGTEAGGVTETTVGGFPAQEFEITVSDPAVELPKMAEIYTARAGDRLHLWIVDVAGATVKIIAEATEADFADYLPIAQAVVDSVSFE